MGHYEVHRRRLKHVDGEYRVTDEIMCVCITIDKATDIQVALNDTDDGCTYVIE